MMMDIGKKTPRRTFFRRVIKAIGGFIGLSLSIPLAAYIISPALKGRSVRRFKVGSISELDPGYPREMNTVFGIQDGWMKTKTARAVWVVKERETGKLRAYNPHCTHLGCAYDWDKGDRVFKCPCHGGVYAIDGKVLAGPPPRPLDTMEYHVEDGNLFVHYQDFKAGTITKIPI